MLNPIKWVDYQKFLNSMTCLKRYIRTQLNSRKFLVRKMILISMGILFLLSVGLIALIPHTISVSQPMLTQHTTTHHLALLEEINNVNARLTEIEQHLSEHNTTAQPIENISKQLANLSAQFQTSLNQSDDHINQHLQ